MPGLDAWLGSLFDEDHLDDTCAVLAGSSEPDPAADQREAELRAAIAACDRKIRNYRKLLDDEDTVTLAAQWIAETQRERKALERQIGEHIPGGELTAMEVKALVAALRNIVDVLADAEPADKAELYNQLGISLRYDPEGLVTVKAQPRGVTLRVGGGALNAALCHPIPYQRDPIRAGQRRFSRRPFTNGSPSVPARTTLFPGLSRTS